MLDENKKKALLSIKKARSMMKKVMDMIENEQYSIDIIQQNLAGIGLIRSANNTIVECYLRECFNDALLTNNEERKEEIIQKLINLNRTGKKA